MKILAIGDVVSQSGCDFLRDNLHSIKSKHNIKMVIANGENASIGNGILPSSMKHLLDSGVDIITTGNHVFKRREIYNSLDTQQNIIRPANYPDSCPGKGFSIIDFGNIKVAVINILGTAFMENVNCPFYTIDNILKKIDTKIIVIDFHAEATGEKAAFGHYLDGKVSCVFGTHTHVQTADEKILPKGTAYISDIGMVGSKYSALGINPQNIIKKMKFHLPVRFEILESDIELNSIIIDIDENTGKAIDIKRLNIS